ncbi:unnamed protein product [Paramecium sonneborni]|uniref:Uncharacterized protein n=1 Tax=Paramecium sonneborni TaxID=65129 RepID=A0A8S1K070_9CILI|nr:unnamed protein product [Paramecium sonneborni]
MNRIIHSIDQLKLQNRKKLIEMLEQIGPNNYPFGQIINSIT